VYVEVEIFWYHLATPLLFLINDVILPVPWGIKRFFLFDEESVKASHFMLLKKYQYLLIQTHCLNWIEEFSVEVGVN